MMTPEIRSLPALLMLAGVLPGAAPPPADRCLAPSRIVTRRPVPPDRLDLALTGGRTAHLTVAGDCAHLPDLDHTYTIIFDEREGDRLCAGYRFRLIDQAATRSGGLASTPFCRVTALTIDRVPASR